MLVRAQSIILWNPFLSQPINSSDNEQESPLVSSNEEILSNASSSTNVVDNTEREHVNLASSISSPSVIGTNATATTAVVVVDPQEDKGKKEGRSDVLSITADHSNNSTITTTNDDTLTLQQNTTSSIISFATISSLLDKPLPSYINSTTTQENETSLMQKNEKSEDGLIYYKRREDFYPQFTNKDGEENDTLSSITNTQQTRRQSLHHVLGKAATKIHPGEGMPIFKHSSTGGSSDSLKKLRPKTVFRRIKTMVVKNKKRLSTI